MPVTVTAVASTVTASVNDSYIMTVAIRCSMHSLCEMFYAWQHCVLCYSLCSNRGKNGAQWSESPHGGPGVLVGKQDEVQGPEGVQI